MGRGVNDAERNKVARSLMAKVLPDIARKWAIEDPNVWCAYGEDGPVDLSRPCVTTLSLSSLLASGLSFDNLVESLPSQTDPVDVLYTSNTIPRKILLAHAVKVVQDDRTSSVLTVLVIKDIKHDLSVHWPAWTETKDLFRQANNFKCSHAKSWSDHHNFVQLASAGAFTDWHTDYSMSGAMLYLCAGEKILYLMPNHERIRRAWRNWYKDDRNSTSWFPESCKPRWPIFRRIVKSSELVWVPPGWAHAVYTTKASMVLSGNLLVYDSLIEACAEYNRTLDSLHNNIVCSQPVCTCAPDFWFEDLPELVLQYTCHLLHSRSTTMTDNFLGSLMSYLCIWSGLDSNHPSYKIWLKKRLL